MTPCWGGADGDVLSGDSLDWEGGGLTSALHGHDLLDGGDGDDSLTGNSGNDILLGGEGNDFIKGDDSSLSGRFGDAYRYHGNDYLQGNKGNDSLLGGGGADSLYGGADDDLLIGDYAELPADYQGADLLDGGSGKDILQGMGGADTLIGGTEDDQLEGDAFDLDSSKHGDDLLRGDAGNDSLWGGGGADTLYGGADDDYLEGDYASQPELYQGADYLDGGLGSDTLVGDGGNDTLLGGSGVDYLAGGSGNNLLDGDSGNDMLEAGTGNDRYVFASGYGQDTIRDEGGENSVQFGVGFSRNELRAEVIQAGGEAALRLFNGASDELLIFDYQGWAESSFSFADGSSLSFAQVMQRVSTPVDANGTVRADSLFGSNLADKLSGNEGNDQLNGQGGADTLVGGLGDDRYYFNKGDGVDVIRDADGINVVRFGAGISSQSLACAVSYTLSGSPVLRLEYEGGSVAIVAGLSGAISRFEFTDEPALSLEQLLERAPGFKLTGQNAGGLLYGGGGADTLTGGRGNDSINAQSGDDLLRGGEGNDWLQGAGGNDWLYGDVGDDHLLGGLGDDSMVGGIGNDTLEGGAGHNTYSFHLGMQRDLLCAEEGSANTLKIDSALDIRDLVYRREGDDLLIEYRSSDDGVSIKDYYSNPQQWNVQLGSGDAQNMSEFLLLLQNSSVEDAGFYEREFRRSIMDRFARDAIAGGYSRDGGGGFYQISITANNYFVYYESTWRRSVLFAEGALESNPWWLQSDGQSLLLSSTHESHVESRREVIESATLFGSDGGQALPGQPEFHSASGSGGFKFDPGSMVLEAKDGFGNSVGWFVYPQGQSSGLGWSQNKLFEWTNYNYIETHKIGRGGDLGGHANVENGNIFYAGDGDDVLVALQGNRVQGDGVMLSGGAGNDLLKGGGYDDFLLGGTGSDYLFGESGKDTYIVFSGDGDDLISDFLLPTDVGDDPGTWEYKRHAKDKEDTLVLPEGVRLSQLVLSWGEIVTDGIYGVRPSGYSYTGTNSLPVARMLYATLDISWGSAQRIRVVMPHANEPEENGIEFFKFSDGTVLTRAELLAHAGMGSVPDPYLLGGLIIDDGGGSFFAENGAPLLGGVGNDTFIGGAGNDVMIGDSGVDTYRYNLGDGDDAIIDVSRYLVRDWDEDYAPLVPLELEEGGVLELGSGVDFDDVYFSFDGADLLVLFSGADGSIRINDWASASSQPLKEIVFSDGIFWNADRLKLLQPLDGARIMLQGSAAADVLSGYAGDEYLTGDAGADTLYGFYGNDTLAGGADDDLLDGGVGPDSMIGGVGNDTYIVDNLNDQLAELSGEGVDLVKSSVSWTLGDNLENLTLSGRAAINGSGNMLNNVLQGNTANNILSGGAGNDTLNGGSGADSLYGGIGNDVYVVNSSLDLIVENADEGIDRVNNSISWALGDNLENLTLTGSAAIGGTGNALNNVLQGNAADNVLHGGAGNDTLRGGGGNDTYVFMRGDGVDRIVENDATAGNQDLALFGEGISHDQLWFRRSANHLELSIIGSDDKLIVQNWYLGEQYRVEQFKTVDGSTLLDSQVQQLVDAMASFAPPAPGQTALPEGYQTALASVIAANWQ